MALATLAILGQRSANSLPIGPVIAEPTMDNMTYMLKPKSNTINESIRQNSQKVKQCSKLTKRQVVCFFLVKKLA
jgi:hypothetical protein